MNRKERRKAKLYLPEEQARDKMRDIFIRMGKFMLRVNDTTLMRDAMKAWYHYCRSKNPATSGIFKALEELEKWEKIVVDEYAVAAAEDALMNSHSPEESTLPNGELPHAIQAP